MSGHVITEDYNNMATIISQGGCDVATTSSPAPLVILSRFFLPFHLSWPQTSDNHVASVHGGWYTVGRGLAVRCSCVVDPYIMMCIVGWAGSSLVLVLFLSTVSSRHPEWDGIVLNVNATCTYLRGNVCSQMLGAQASTDCDKVPYPFRKGKTPMLKTLKELDLPGLFGVLENEGVSSSWSSSYQHCTDNLIQFIFSREGKPMRIV